VQLIYAPLKKKCFTGTLLPIAISPEIMKKQFTFLYNSRRYGHKRSYIFNTLLCINIKNKCIKTFLLEL
jgi:hypothetical protein